MEPGWFTPAEKSTRGWGLRLFRSCPNKWKPLKFDSPTFQVESRVAVHAWRSKTVSKVVRYFHQDFVLLGGLIVPDANHCSSQIAGKSILITGSDQLPAVLTGTASLTSTPFWYSSSWGQQPPKKKNEKFSVSVLPSYNHPQRKKENPKPDACKLGFEKQGRAGTVCLLLFTLDSIRKP